MLSKSGPKVDFSGTAWAPPIGTAGLLLKGDFKQRKALADRVCNRYCD